MFRYRAQLYFPLALSLALFAQPARAGKERPRYRAPGNPIPIGIASSGRNRISSVLAASRLRARKLLVTPATQVANLGIGVVPVDTGELAHELRTNGFVGKLYGTELPRSIPLAHLRSRRIDNTFAEEVMRVDVQLPSDRIRGFRLLIDAAGRPYSLVADVDKQGGSSHLLVGNALEAPHSASAEPWGGARQVELFDRVLAELGGREQVERLVSAHASGEPRTLAVDADITLEVRPLELHLAAIGAELLAGATPIDAGLPAGTLDLIVANHVYAHIPPAERAAWLHDAASSLTIGGELLLKYQRFNGRERLELHRHVGDGVLQSRGYLEGDALTWPLTAPVDGFIAIDAP